MNVVLIGFRGAGKSTIGKALSERLGREFIDCDAWIEKHTGLTIKEIFEKHGESHFRTLESQAIDPDTGKTVWDFKLFQGSLGNGVLASATAQFQPAA